MRTAMIILAMLLGSHASAQATFGVGVGTTGCQEVSRQIVRDWFDVRDVMSSGESKRPSAHELHCVSPAYARNAMPRRVGGSALQCFKLQGKGVCCDAQLQECATR